MFFFYFSLVKIFILSNRNHTVPVATFYVQNCNHTVGGRLRLRQFIFFFETINILWLSFATILFFKTCVWSIVTIFVFLWNHKHIVGGRLLNVLFFETEATPRAVVCDNFVFWNRTLGPKMSKVSYIDTKKARIVKFLEEKKWEKERERC